MHCYFLLLAFLCFSCNGQGRTSPPIDKQESSLSKLPKIKRPKGAENIRFGEGLQDRAGHLWFATTGDGVYRYDGTSFTHFTKQDGLSDSIVNSILEDRAGNLLFGTGKGISKWDGKSFTPFTQDPVLKDQPIWALLEDKAGDLWISAPHSGLYRFDGKTFSPFLKDSGNPNKVTAGHPVISDILQDKAGNLWFSSWNRCGVWRYDGKAYTNYLPPASYYQPPDTSAKSTNAFSGLLPKQRTYETISPTLTDDMIFSITEDRSGNIWFATRDHGACRYNGKTFTSFRDKEGFRSRGAHSICEAQNGLIWLGTEHTGAWKYDGKSFVNYTVKDGLRNNSVFQILEDAAGNLWLSTRDFGLTRYDGRTFTDMTE